MKRKVTLRIILDTDSDEFGINMDTEGFDEKTPQQNSLVIASILKVVQDQELEQFRKRGKE